MNHQIDFIKKIFPMFLWGNSIALSWIWGLGLFFSIQFTTQFGLFGLLTFLIPNCLGLFLFGVGVNYIAKKQVNLALFFYNWSRPFRFVFFIYQIFALALTIFALIRYGVQPLGMKPDSVYLPLTAIVILATSILFGEEFSIRRIKYSHIVFLLLTICCITVICSQLGFSHFKNTIYQSGIFLPHTLNFFGYVIPMFIGLLLGPWLDLQQWQRVIEIQKEKKSILFSYLFGAIIFGSILFFHGILALIAMKISGQSFIPKGLAGYSYAESMITNCFLHIIPFNHLLLVSYILFLSIATLTTLDSGYIALNWFFKSNVSNSQNPIFVLIPQQLIISPIPIFIFCALIAIIGTALSIELEYFIIFFVTFFVGYSPLAIGRAFKADFFNIIPQIKIFCIGVLGVVIFSYGYILHQPVFQICSSLLPLGYILWLMIKHFIGEDGNHTDKHLDSNIDYQSQPISSTENYSGKIIAPTVKAIQGIFGYFEDKWFVYSFIATYADTNSVGNVYFGMYAMWVGKTRELFFNHVMPKFNLKDTLFYILTRSFEHKFIRETKEFETISVKIRVATHNRKFVTLAHEIYDSSGHLLGKGSQILLFVSSINYKMIDIPSDVIGSFLPYI